MSSNNIAENELAIFCEQIAMVLKSGVPLYEGLEAVCENYEGTRYEKEFGALNEDYQHGSTFYEACLNVGVFPDYMVEMINVGEKSGKLDDVMTNLSKFYDREDKIRSMIKSAVLQPSIMMVVMGAVVLLLVVKVLPVFKEVFKNLGSSFSETTNQVINVCTNVGIVLLVVLILMIIIGAVFGFLLNTSKKQKILNLVGKIIPPVSRIRKQVASERFASVMSMMLGSGYNLTEALEMSEKIVEDEQFIKNICMCESLVKQDVPFATALERSEVFDKLYLRMVQVGVTTGQMDHVFDKVANIYEEEVDTRIHNVISWIEPALVAVMTVMIGAILLSVMLPLITIINHMG